MASKLQNGAAICMGQLSQRLFQPLGVMLGNPQVELAGAGSADVVMDDPIARAQGVAEHDERLDVRFAGHSLRQTWQMKSSAVTWGSVSANSPPEQWLATWPEDAGVAGPTCHTAIVAWPLTACSAARSEPSYSLFNATFAESLKPAADGVQHHCPLQSDTLGRLTAATCRPSTGQAHRETA